MEEMARGDRVIRGRSYRLPAKGPLGSFLQPILSSYSFLSQNNLFLIDKQQFTYYNVVTI